MVYRFCKFVTPLSYANRKSGFTARKAERISLQSYSDVQLSLRVRTLVRNSFVTPASSRENEL
jgi:hypothetical protein